MKERTFRLQIYAKQYERLCRFYGETMKFPVLIQRETSQDDRVRVYGAASGQIEVIYAPEWMEYPVSNGWTVQIEVEDVDSCYEQILQEGGKVLREPQDQFWGHRNFKILDPSGMELTIYSERNRTGPGMDERRPSP